MIENSLILILGIILGVQVNGQQSSTPPSPATAPVSAHTEELHPADGAVLVSWEESLTYIGEPVLVYGKIVAGKDLPDKCYLNFHEDFRTHLSLTLNKTAALWPANPDQFYLNKTVAVVGEINDEGGRPELLVTDPKLMVVIPENETDAAAWLKKQFPLSYTPQELTKLRQPRTQPDQIRIATYNILNLFDAQDDPFKYDEVMDTKPRDQMSKVAARIRDLNADVITLEEVENWPYLQRFIRAYLPDMGYDYVTLIEGNNHRGIDVAVASRYPMGPVTTYRHLKFPGPDGKTYPFQRDFLQVAIDGPGDFDFTVFAVHLKSKYGGAEVSEPVRQAEAKKIRELMDHLLKSDPQARFVICGDFNDYWDSPSLKMIRGSGSMELTCPGTVEIPEDRRITYNREPHRSMIDFIVCSPAMAKAYVAGSYKIIDGTEDNSGSDHNPSVAVFTTGNLTP